MGKKHNEILDSSASDKGKRIGVRGRGKVQKNFNHICFLFDLF